MKAARYVLAVSLVLVAFIVVPTARADTFTPTFTCTGTCVSVPTAPAVSFQTGITETEITYIWDNIPISLFLAIGDKPGDTYVWEVFNTSPSEPELLAVIHDENNNDQPVAFIPTPAPLSGQVVNDSGPLVFTPAPVPEPSSLLLLGTGFLSLAGAMRRKRLTVS